MAVDRAMAPGMPATCSPPVRAASTGPRPPGVGMTEPRVFAVRNVTVSCGMGRRLPNAIRHAPNVPT